MSLINQVLMKQILEQYFLRLNGKRAMTGDLDLATYALLTTNLSLHQMNPDYFAILDRARVDPKSLYLDKLWTKGAVGIGCEPPTLASETFFKVVMPSGYYHFHVEGSRPNNIIYFFMRNTGYADTNTKVAFCWQVPTTEGNTNALMMIAGLSNIVPATRQSLCQFSGWRAGVWNDFMRIDGGDVTFPKGNVTLATDKKLQWKGVLPDTFDVNLYRSAVDVLKTDDLLDAVLGFQVNGVAGVDGTFESADGKTVTVTKGIITSIV